MVNSRKKSVSIPHSFRAHPSTLRNLVVSSEIHFVQVTSPKLRNLMGRRNMLMIPSGWTPFVKFNAKVLGVDRESYRVFRRCCPTQGPSEIAWKRWSRLERSLVSTARLRGRFGVVFDDAQLSNLGCRSVEGL